MFTLSSAAFEPNGSIPARLTCEGADYSPPLAWNDAPEGTVTFALIVDDPDAPDPAAPKMTWVHWVAYNIPTHVSSLEENAARHGMPAGSGAGENDWKRTGYGGPCPPIGRHRYFHKLYALDTVLPDLGTPTKSVLEAAMQGHLLAEVDLIGTYEKARRTGR